MLLLPRISAAIQGPSLDALRKDPFCLKYTGSERGDSFDRRTRRFWWKEHSPDGPNALRLTELDVYLGDDGIDDDGDGKEVNE